MSTTPPNILFILNILMSTTLPNILSYIKYINEYNTTQYIVLY